MAPGSPTVVSHLHRVTEFGLSAKESAYKAGDAGDMGWEDPLEEGIATYSSILA